MDVIHESQSSLFNPAFQLGENNLGNKDLEFGFKIEIYT